MSENVKLHLVLDYHDAVLYPFDMNLLESPTAWLNDSCMHFYLTVLQQRNTNTSSIAYMDPSVISFLMHQCDDLDDFSFPAVETIVIPINDGHAPSSHWSQAGRGSHWSLLVIKSAGMYWHLDSVHGRNREAASAVAKKCQQILGHAASSIIDVETPQQDNGSDCGLHALCAAELVSGCESVEAMEAAMTQRVGKGFGNEMRQRVLEQAKRLIEDFHMEYSSP
jgi:sentrin-specific protease 8